MGVGMINWLTRKYFKFSEFAKYLDLHFFLVLVLRSVNEVIFILIEV